MLAGSVRRVYGDCKRTSIHRADRRPADVQADCHPTAGSQVCRQLHRLLLVQREVQRHSDLRDSTLLRPLPMSCDVARQP